MVKISKALLTTQYAILVYCTQYALLSMYALLIGHQSDRYRSSFFFRESQLKKKDLTRLAMFSLIFYICETHDTVPLKYI